MTQAAFRLLLLPCIQTCDHAQAPTPLLCSFIRSSFCTELGLDQPDYKYNYSNDGTDTISNQVFVTHVDTLGVDSFRYELNRIAFSL